MKGFDEMTTDIYLVSAEATNLNFIAYEFVEKASAFNDIFYSIKFDKNRVQNEMDFITQISKNASMIKPRSLLMFCENPLTAIKMRQDINSDSVRIIPVLITFYPEDVVDILKNTVDRCFYEDIRNTFDEIRKHQKDECSENRFATIMYDNDDFDVYNMVNKMLVKALYFEPMITEESNDHI